MVLTLWSVITKSRIALKTSCNALAIGVQNLLLQLGIHNCITTNKAHDVKFPNGTYTCKESYDVNIVQFTSLLLFTKKINFKQQYKRDALFAMLLARSPAIESVRFDGVEEVFDFTEPETHWGVVNNFISHNCGELVFLNNTACNLASLNLSKFADDTGFNATQFRHAVRLFVIAQDILVEASGYPTSTIEKNTHKYRPLGLGYTNLGGFLMSNAIPYDSNEGRAIATSITNLLTSQAYLTSSEIASHMGPFAGFEDNKTHMEDVLDMHYTAAKHAAIDPWGLNKAALTTWRSTINTGFGKKEAGTGFRNSQTTLLAPTGTLSFMMDCSTTGIEPDIGLKKTKRQVDGTVITYVNSSVPSALKKLDYEDEHQERLLAYVNEHGHLENSILKSEHLPIFDCSLPVANRRLSVDGHLDMVAAVQPFLSGSISKTYNMPHNASLNDIALVFLKAWEKKVKGITIYRDGSKMSEPLKVKELLKEAKSHAHREVLPNDRDSKTHKFTIGGQSGYLTVGFYPDGRIGEIFLRMGGHGATITGLLDAFATACSFLLQHGVPLELLIRKFKKTKFNPAGITGNPDVPMADSVLAYVFRFLEIHYLKKTEETNTETAQLDISADLCSNCGNIMVRTGTCLQCKNCGESQGVCS
jgi:ribonucleoside-diphosphate reductase alpha chain